MIAIAEQIAQELDVAKTQVTAAINLLDEGATVPFIARYRKEATKGLDDNHLRQLAQRLSYLRDLNERRQVILLNIEQQGKLTEKLAQEINQADNKTRLEDLYLPYKPKRKTKGQTAIQAGLAPLAEKILANKQLIPEQEATSFINKAAGYADEQAVLEGVLYILAEQFAEDANLIQKLRRHILAQAHLVSKVSKGQEQQAKKYKDYFAHSELLKKVPSHRMLAMLRGRNEGLLTLKIDVDPNQDSHYCSAQQLISDHYRFNLTGQNSASFLTKVIQTSWKQKLKPALDNELVGYLREQAETEAIKVFARNLKDLLLAAPAGNKVTLGLDPGLRTGCKLAIVDTTGKLLQTATIFPHAPQNHWGKSVRTITNLCQQHKVELIAIGNGTASRESEKLIAEAISKLEQSNINKVVVSEAGASVYSASELAANEFPALDVSIRGAVSIARRLQDPLAELVKIDAKAIGVGQYQHDVNQSQLSQALDNVIEDCVNAVGVDLNSASVPLLTHIAGLNKTIATNIVKFRDEHGRFTNRNQLKKVTRLGPKAFEQAAGFLRIHQGENPLDSSGVHPETYPLVKQILMQINANIEDVISDSSHLNKINKAQLCSEQFGEITINDIVQELEKPGRDPRPAFKTATFKEGVNKISDLTLGMTLEGVISNVANFGAFVDIGVHQDGLVHISSLTNKFVSDPHEIVKAGDIVKVKVIELDVERKRISLTMRLDDTPSAPVKTPKTHKAPAKPKAQVKRKQATSNAAMGNAFADAFAKLKK